MAADYPAAPDGWEKHIGSGLGLCGFSLLVVAAVATLAIINRTAIHDLEHANAINIVLPIGFALLGGLVASRQPRSGLGGVFLGISIATAVPGLTEQYTRFALVTQRNAPFSMWIPWVGSLLGVAVYPCGLALLAILTIPNGRFLSPRWAVVAWTGGAITLMVAFSTAVDPSGIGISGLRVVPNPTGLTGLADLSQAIGFDGYLIGLGVLAAAGTSLLVRLRRAVGEERLQLRWVAYGAGFAVALNVIVSAAGIPLLSAPLWTAITTITALIGFGVVLPVSFAVAILRYRLYDLDLLVNRTILYALVSAMLLMAFAVANVLAQGAIRSTFAQGSDLAAAALGLVAGLAFAPLRRRLRPLVDRALPARSRLTLLFTDIVESTQAVVDLGDERWRGVLARYRGVVRQALARYRGREVNTAGDAFFAVFDRPGNAVNCATALREGVVDLGLQVRTGLHVGEVAMRGEQVSGLAVHAAARIMAEAGPGEILLSGDLASLLPESRLRDAGQRSLRGVPGEWRLYGVVTG